MHVLYAPKYSAPSGRTTDSFYRDAVDQGSYLAYCKMLTTLDMVKGLYEPG